MKNHCRESVGFLFRATLWFRRLVILFSQSFLRSMLHNSTFLLFRVLNRRRHPAIDRRLLWDLQPLTLCLSRFSLLCFHTSGFAKEPPTLSVITSFLKIYLEPWLFSPSSVMILLPFLSWFLLFFFVKDEIASFQLKQIIVFLNYRKCSVCVFISLHDCDRV